MLEEQPTLELLPEIIDDKSACVSQAFRYLRKLRKVTVREIAKATNISENTLYSINARACDRASMQMLKTLADYFQTDISIFCGVKDYHPPFRPTQQQKELLTLFGELNDEAKRKVLEYIDDIHGNPKNCRK